MFGRRKDSVASICVAIFAFIGVEGQAAAENLTTPFVGQKSVGEAQVGSRTEQGVPADMATVMESVIPRQATKSERQQAEDMSSPVARVVVFGDSHASRLHAPLVHWGFKNNYAVEYMKMGGGCPALLDTYVFTFQDKDGPATCNTEGPNNFRQLGSRRLDAVIIVSRWGLYTTGLSSLDSRVPGRITGQSRSISQDINAGFIDDIELSRKAFENGVRATVRYFKSKGVAVIFVTQPPPVGSGLLKCIAEQAMPSDVLDKCFPITYQDQLSEIQWSTDRLLELSKELDFNVVNAHDVFCENHLCRAMGKEGVYYTDGDHLSYYGASLVAKEVEKVIVNLK